MFRPMARDLLWWRCKGGAALVEVHKRPRHQRSAYVLAGMRVHTENHELRADSRALLSRSEEAAWVLWERTEVVVAHRHLALMCRHQVVRAVLHTMGSPYRL